MNTLVTPILAFGSHLLVGLAFLLAFLLLYMWATPHREMALIRTGNGPAAVGLGGAALGFAIALSTAISVSESIVEASIWALIALLAQLASVFALRLAIPDLFKSIADGVWAPAIIKAAAAVAVGMINAACMVP